MRTPSMKRLVDAFPNLTEESAKLIKELGKMEDATSDELREFIESEPQLQATADYWRSLYHPHDLNAIWRRTMVLHAIDVLVEGFGVEHIGPRHYEKNGSGYDYCNMGDPYTTTLIIGYGSNTLYIGCWGDIAEQHPDW